LLICKGRSVFCRHCWSSVQHVGHAVNSSWPYWDGVCGHNCGPLLHIALYLCNSRRLCGVLYCIRSLRFFYFW
jgi:hypothetical protein